MAKNFLTQIFGSRNDRLLKQYRRTVERISALEPEFEKLTDDQLRAKTQEFKDRVAKGESLDDLLAEAFAVVREAGVEGWLRFTRVDWQRRPIAFHFGFHFQRCFLWYKPTFAVDLARHSPGEVLLRQLLVAAIAERAHTFDFGLGDEAYDKRESVSTMMCVPRLGRIRGTSASSWSSSGRRRSAQTPVALTTFDARTTNSSPPSPSRTFTPAARPASSRTSSVTSSLKLSGLTVAKMLKDEKGTDAAQLEVTGTRLAVQTWCQTAGTPDSTIKEAPHL